MKILAIIILTLLPVIHPLKISNAIITYNKETGNVEVSITFFAEDFGDHLKEVYKLREINLIDPARVEKDVVGDYINKHFQIGINHKVYNLIVKDIIDKENDVVEIVLSIPGLRGSHITLLELTDELLFDAFDEQMNLVHVNLSDEVAFRFKQGNAYQALTLDYRCK